MARTARDAGMERAKDAAERRQPTWGDVAYGLIERHARKHKLFTAEDFTDAAADFGLETKDGRAFGSIFHKAVRNGIIKRSNVTYQRRYGHAAVGVAWESLVFTGVVA